MTTYRVGPDGHFYDKATGERVSIERRTICTPHIISDIEPYRSPVTGEVIGGRAARRDDLKKHDAVDAREVRGDTFGKRRGVRTEKWAKRLGLPLIGRDI